MFCKSIHRFILNNSSVIKGRTINWKCFEPKLNKTLIIRNLSNFENNNKNFGNDFDLNKKNINKCDLNDRQLIDMLTVRPIDGMGKRIDYELLDEMSPTVPQSFNLAAFADKSETLQMFIKLGVNLYFIERRSLKNAEFLLRLDFETDVKPYLRFLVDNGVKSSDLGNFVTKNPLIFGENMDDLKVRINYLQSKRFTKQMIANIITKWPPFLINTTKIIDYKLGFIQKEFHLTPNELRQVVTDYPKIFVLRDLSYREMSFMFKEEFGFNVQEIKEIFLKFPYIWRKCSVHKYHRCAVAVFDYIHNEMKIPHELICKFPQILDRRLMFIQWRHLYLKKLGRDQYDPKLPLYVPLTAFYELEDNEFCDKYAKTSVKDFNMFCKTI